MSEICAVTGTSNVPARGPNPSEDGCKTANAENTGSPFGSTNGAECESGVIVAFHLLASSEPPESAAVKVNAPKLNVAPEVSSGSSTRLCRISIPKSIACIVSPYIASPSVNMCSN
ncbi:MAG: Uncharacterised protein [Methanobacteriota archaeon]|nr:MAG: Uncharacterised protein [Euryarchaeota archaeon]